MLFSSYPFLFLYLPTVLAGFFLAARAGQHAAAVWLAAASLFFYGWWNPIYVTLLLGSIAFNYALGTVLARSRPARTQKLLLTAAVAANLGLLGYFKYANFFVDTSNRLLGLDLPLSHVLLPLGISFFTFTQIAFLVDVSRGLARESKLTHYVLFVTYFPHLIAGPVLHHKQMMPQFAQHQTYRFSSANLVFGLAMLSLGLAKKVLLADSLAEYANPVFDGARDGQAPEFVTAWAGALAYALQLYFDFSGYSDMAIGLSMMFGVRLPINFNSPYQATSIIEFWRRWHMTLSQFLRDYLYIALGGNRDGRVRRYVNLMLTMVLGGLWHGASWTFVVWGTLHGVFLVVNHGWTAFKPRLRWLQRVPALVRHLSAGALTFLCVLVAWVVFRADTFLAANAVIRGMLGLNGVTLPSRLDVGAVRQLGAWLGGWRFDGFFADNEKLHVLGAGPFVATTALALFIVWVCPNTQRLLGYTVGAPRSDGAMLARSTVTWTPRVWSAVLLSVLFGLSLASFSKTSPFLYFQF